MGACTQTLFWITLTVFLGVAVQAAWKCNSCEIQIKAVGCFKDKDGKRALPDQILNERDSSSKVFGNRLIDWHDWNNYMEGFACRCARVALKNGYQHFGLQFYGECWGKKGSTKVDYAKYGVTKTCVSDDYKPCDKFSRECVGEQWTNFVYEIVPRKCSVNFERLGCFSDHHIKGARPLPHYLLTDREKGLDIYSGHPIDWRNWDVYVPEFACRCAEAAKKKGHTTFGLQFYGECWSGADSHTYYKDGRSSNCIGQCFKPCKPWKKYCHGKEFANAVYRLSDTPCEYNMQSLGCFAENTKYPTLNVKLVDEHDPTSIHFNGDVLKETSWEKEYPRLLCRCARAAAERGMKNFGVDNNGVCWGAKHDYAYKFYGKSSHCTRGKTQCPIGSSSCKNANFVYQIQNPRKRTLDNATFHPEFDNDQLAEELQKDMTSYDDTLVDDLLQDV